MLQFLKYTCPIEIQLKSKHTKINFNNLVLKMHTQINKETDKNNEKTNKLNLNWIVEKTNVAKIIENIIDKATATIGLKFIIFFIIELSIQQI